MAKELLTGLPIDEYMRRRNAGHTFWRDDQGRVLTSVGGETPVIFGPAIPLTTEPSMKASIESITLDSVRRLRKLYPENFVKEVMEDAESEAVANSLSLTAAVDRVLSRRRTAQQEALLRAETGQQTLEQVFAQDPALYERYRAEAERPDSRPLQASAARKSLPDSATAALTDRVERLRAADPKLTLEAAQLQVFAQAPALYEAYVKRTEVQVGAR